MIWGDVRVCERKSKEQKIILALYFFSLRHYDALLRWVCSGDGCEGNIGGCGYSERGGNQDSGRKYEGGCGSVVISHCYKRQNSIRVFSGVACHLERWDGQLLCYFWTSSN